jgi:hypothetical protein
MTSRAREKTLDALTVSHVGRWIRPSERELWIQLDGVFHGRSLLNASKSRDTRRLDRRLDLTGADALHVRLGDNCHQCLFRSPSRLQHAMALLSAARAWGLKEGLFGHSN